MIQDTKFYKQVELLLKILPEALAEDCFSLKGGTAINMFVRDMPRLSVDIDLCYHLIEDRKTTLNKINEALMSISKKICSKYTYISVKNHPPVEGIVTRLYISEGTTTIKVEVNFVLRGTVNPCVDLDLCEKSQEIFKTFRTARCLSIEDLYGGKICAALDRQHPRDLFDIKLLLENEGLTDSIRQSFLVYLVSHNRPMSDLIDPNRLDFKDIYEKEFKGMTDVDVKYQDLVDVRENLITTILKDLTDKEREFLVLLKRGKPQWNLLPIKDLDRLPAIQWKLININKMDRSKHKESVKILEKKLLI